MLIDNKHILEIELEGSVSDNGAVRVTDLQQFLQQLMQILGSVEREVIDSGKPATFYRVVSLSYASPVRVSIEAVTEPGTRDVGSAIVSRFTKEVQEVNAGTEPEGIDFTTLEMMMGLSSGYKKHLTAIRLGTHNETFPIAQDFDLKIRRLLGNVYRTHGTFRGRLETVNLHTNPSAVNIYPVAGPSKIRCVFKKGKFPNIGQLLEQTVDVYGVMLYRGDNPHPHQIEIETITPLRPQSELPTAAQIVGSMPDLGGDLDTVSYLKRLRQNEAV